MKNLNRMALAILVSLLGSLSWGQSLAARSRAIDPSAMTIAPSRIAKVTTFSQVKNSVERKVNIVLEDKGMTSDIAPRYSLHLGYLSNAETGSYSVDYVISSAVTKLISAKQLNPARFELKYIERDIRDGTFTRVTEIIDIAELFEEDYSLRQDCGAFCDETLQTPIIAILSERKKL